MSGKTKEVSQLAEATYAHALRGNVGENKRGAPTSHHTPRRNIAMYGGGRGKSVEFFE